MRCVHCDRPANFTSKGGKALCERSAQMCPTVKAVNSARLKEAHQAKPIWRVLTPEARAAHAWHKGQTKETNLSLLAMANKLKGRRKLTDIREFERRMYYNECDFTLKDVSLIAGYELLKEHGMYDINRNPNGVVRDHRLSRAYGFKHGIDPKIMSHPANCEFILFKDNARKSLTSSVSLDQLLIEIVGSSAEIGKRR